jgi:23S rRNA pseudouridine1911/1915/1917 synthase
LWNDFDNLDDFISKSNSQRRIGNLNVVENEIVITARPMDVGERLDKFLHSHFASHTRSHFQKLISRGNVLVNNSLVKSGYKLRKNDKILIHFEKAQPSKILPENVPLNILYEDNHLLVINKSAGLVVHPGAGHRSGTMVNGLLFHCKTLSGINGVLRPGIVHRLDKNTSGLIVVAKRDESHVFISKQFETRDIIRTYHAFIWGVPSMNSGEIATKIDRSHRDRKKMSVTMQRGRQAITRYTIIQSFNYFCLLELTLKTGRTHQIRVHLNHINHPVFGDPDYNGRNVQLKRLPASIRSTALELLKIIDRQALHAKKVSFIHPESKERISFDTELPEDMIKLKKALINNPNL